MSVETEDEGDEANEITELRDIIQHLERKLLRRSIREEVESLHESGEKFA